MKIVQRKICLLGDFAVGKTSLVRQYVEGRFDEKYLTTIGVTISRKTLERRDHVLNLLIWDLAGGEQFKKYESSYLRGAAGALVVCDLTRRETIKYISTYAEQMRLMNSDAPLVVVGNKVDLEEDRELTESDLDSIATHICAPSILTSAKSGENVETCVHVLVDLIERINDPFPSE